MCVSPCVYVVCVSAFECQVWISLSLVFGCLVLVFHHHRQLRTIKASRASEATRDHSLKEVQGEKAGDHGFNRGVKGIRDQHVGLSQKEREIEDMAFQNGGNDVGIVGATGVRMLDVSRAEFAIGPVLAAPGFSSQANQASGTLRCLHVHTLRLAVCSSLPAPSLLARDDRVAPV